jgi:hypothetical protein
MDHIFLDEAEKAKHRDAIHRLCEEFPDKVDFIRHSYLEVLERVAAEATIRTYLTILITREVKTLLRIQELTQPD